MRVAIAYPPLQGDGVPLLGQNRQFQWFHNPSYIYPMVPAMAATVCRQAGLDTAWLDGIAKAQARPAFEADLAAFAPDLVLLETKTPVVKQHWDIIRDWKTRWPAMRLALAGDHVTALPEESLRQSPVDYVIPGGYYDLVFRDLALHLAGRGDMPEGVWLRDGDQIRATGSTRDTADLDSLPFLDRELTEWQRYGEKLYKYPPFTYMLSGRDCPWARCRFCSWTTLYPKFRVRSPENVLDEIQQVVERYGVREIFDDTGTFPSGGWMEKFCAGMMSRGLHRKVIIDGNFRFDYITLERAKLMKKAGFRLMKFGLESGNQATLDRLDKGVRLEQITEGCRMAKRAGLEVHLTIMVGYPWETRADAQRTLDLAKRLMLSGQADMLQATVTIPYPGTPLYAEAVRENWLRYAPGEWEKFDMTQPVFKTPDMSPEEVMAMCDNIYKIFLHPRYVLRYLGRVRSLGDVAYLARGARAVVGHILDFNRPSQVPEKYR